MKPFQVPLFDTPFHTYSAQQADSFARRVGWVDDMGVIDCENGIIQSKPVPWWEGSELITAQSPDWGATMAAWVLNSKTNRLVRLDGTSPPIHSLNAQYGFQLSRDLALPYLGFFCTFVHGGDGMFGLLNASDDALLPDNWPADKYGHLIKPTTLVSEEDGDYRVEATVYYSDALFWAHFLVKSGGMCEMIDDEPYVADLGLKIELRLKFAEEDEPAATGEPEQPVH